MKIIDFHTHLEDHWFAKKCLSEQQFLRGLDAYNIDVACIYTLMGFYSDCPGHNDLLVEAAKKNPDRLIPFVTVDPKLGDPAVEELERCLSNPVFRGVKFHPWVQAFAPSMVRETMVKILKCAARYRTPVLFHDGTPPYSTTFQIAAMARWVPEATVVLGHGGLADYAYPAGQLLRDLPNLYVCACGPKAGDMPYLVEMAGEDRVIWGSDFGFSDPRIIAERLDDVLESGLPPRVQEKIFYDNAARVLKMNERPLPKILQKKER
ncbi:MAG TPA: amidohydrolase family protein [Planctomycetota bacterium]|nr:amidohydrolase family protein [Planctomycetota bacterium]